VTRARCVSACGDRRWTVIIADDGQNFRRMLTYRHRMSHLVYYVQSVHHIVRRSRSTWIDERQSNEESSPQCTERRLAESVITSRRFRMASSFRLSTTPSGREGRWRAGGRSHWQVDRTSVDRIETTSCRSVGRRQGREAKGARRDPWKPSRNSRRANGAYAHPRRSACKSGIIFRLVRRFNGLSLTLRVLPSLSLARVRLQRIQQPGLTT